MYIPVLSKMSKKNNVFVERALPHKGMISVQKGDVVKPYDQLGSSFTDETTGTTAKVDFQLLAGVWGVVKDVAEDVSALIETQVTDINFAISTKFACSGELLVFPNPSKQLTKHYMSQFSKDSAGKIVYVGEHLDSDLLKKAIDLDIAAVIAGSCDVDTYKLAKRHQMGLGLILGVGELSTPSNVYEYLGTITNRYVFFRGDKGFLRVPEESKFKTSETNKRPIKLLKKGMSVQVFEQPNMGKLGIVDSIKGSSIFVRVSGINELITVTIPNLLIID